MATHTLSFSLQAFAETIRAELDKFPSDVRDDVVILFSAHSLPLKVESEGGSREGGGGKGRDLETGKEGGKGG